MFAVISENFAGFTVKIFREILELLLTSIVFLFKSKPYLLGNGPGMGLPLAPTIANLLISYHEGTWLKNSHLSSNLSFSAGTLMIALTFLNVKITCQKLFNI